MIAEAPRVAPSPRSRSAAHSAAVPATMAMSTDSASTPGWKLMPSRIRIAYMPV
jgi:hypothetical protein